MDKIEKKFNEIRRFCRENANPDVVKKYARFFTEGYDAYGLTRELLVDQRDKLLKDWEAEMTLEDYLDLGDKLVATGKYEEASFAVSFIYTQAEKLIPETLERLGGWLENGIVNWGHTDVLSGMALAPFITRGLVEIEAFSAWIGSPSKWKRRAVPVTLVEILKTDLPLERMLEVIDPLMPDPDKFVQKGLGWFLREAWKLHREQTEDFLLKWKDTCGRTIIQYATEKMTKEERLRFRRAKPAGAKK